MFGSPHFGDKKKKVAYDRRQDIEPHEIFYDHLARKYEEKQRIGEKKFEISLSRKALRIPMFLAVFFFAIAFFRVVELYAVEGQELKRAAEQNKYIFFKVQSERGIIYDSVFNPLVANLSTFDLQCSSDMLPSGDPPKNKIISSLADAAGLDRGELERAITDSRIPTVENLEHKALVILEARASDFPGCSIVRRPIRDYERGAGLAHLLGYMGRIDTDEWKAQTDIYSINDYVGKAGLEKSYESVLRKDPGKLRIERDAKGNIISQDVAANPESGDSIQLWLDAALQKKLFEAMDRQLKNLGLTKGAAVALDPNTGGVLAMTSFPDFDNNLFSAGEAQSLQKMFDDQDKPLFNRVIAGQYLTGSTIKPFEAAGALQENLIDPGKKINCPGKITVQNRYNPEIIYTYNDNHTHGPTDMRKAIAESCNVYFWTIGGGYGDQKGLGPTRIKKYLELFGWGSATGIDISGEAGGFIPTPDWKKEKFSGTQDSVWSDGDTYNLAIGQGFIGITPLQVVTAFAAIANGGTLYKPQMVKSVVDSARNVIEAKQPVIVRQNFIDAAHLEVAREGMRHGVNGAGAPLASSLVLNSLGVPMAAKTGTAQLRKDAAGKDLMNSWVTVFAPYDDPKIVLTVMMENVREGQLAVLPVVKEVLGWYFSDQKATEVFEAATTTPGTIATTTPEQAQIEEQLRQIQTQVIQLQNTAPTPPPTAIPEDGHGI
jgi:penicillin-binding protein 2